jgi:hypothetical protein
LAAQAECAKLQNELAMAQFSSSELEQVWSLSQSCHDLTSQKSFIYGSKCNWIPLIRLLVVCVPK